MENLSITAANENDIPLVADILSDATQHKIKLGDRIWGDAGWSKEEVQESMAESTMYLIHHGDEVVGTVSLQWEDERNWGPQPPVAGYLHRLAIKDGFHGKGLGEQVVNWAAAQVADRGRQFLRLDCEAKNTQLCAYYENQGFVRVGERPIPEYGDYVAALFEREVK